MIPTNLHCAMHTPPSVVSAPPAPVAGQAVRSLLDSASHYLAARLSLARMEGREALRAGVGILALGLVAGLSLAVAYAGFMTALVWWLAEVWGGGAGTAMAALVLGHLLVAAASAGWLAHVVRRRRFFHATRKEFMEDKKWLESHHPSRS